MDGTLTPGVDAQHGGTQGGLRARTARGVVFNGVFLVGLTGIGGLEGLIVARFITPAQFGLWGMLLGVLGLIWWLKDVGVSDKYIQQSDVDQEDAFAKAFGMHCAIMGVCFLLMIGAVPLLSVVYGQPQLLAPGLLLALIVPANAMQFPLAVFQRRMDWARQRTLQAVEPVLAFVVTVMLVILGFGYWGPVIGALAGAWATAVAALVACPLPRRWRFERRAMRVYLGFSLPVVLYSGAGVAVGQGIFIAGSRTLGLASLGAIALAASVAQFTDRADSAVTLTLYPAICAVQDRFDLLRESFQKSNRLTLMWGMPFGVGLALFAPDLVKFVLGYKWLSAVGLLQALGLIAATHHIAFNWDAFYRARGNSRPLGIAGVFIIAVTFAITVPLMIALGFTGFIIGMAVGQASYLVFRGVFLTRLLPGVNFVHHVWRGVAPTVPPAALILALRLLEPRRRTLLMALSEVTIYCVCTVITTWVFERDLLREVYGYVRRRTNTALSASMW